MRNLMMQFILWLALVPMWATAQVATPPNPETGAINFGSPLAGVYAASSILRARDYGILPSNPATVNDIGFTALKKAMQASPTTVWRVIFEPGAYVYTYPLLFWGVRNLIMEAYGATFQNTSAAIGSAVPIASGDFFQDWGDIVFPGTGVYSGGYLFNTASAGASSLTTTTHADAGNFTSGMRVFLGGYDQQFSGYPPNLRYFEYKTVLTANATTGVVTFTNPLRYLYDSRWWDTPDLVSPGKPAGAPRIWSLERPNFVQPRLIWIKGATFLPPLNFPTNYPVVNLNADLVIFEDVTGNTLNVGQSGTTILKRCSFISNTALFPPLTPDKLIDGFVAEDSTFDGTLAAGIALIDAVGVNSLSIARSKFNGALNVIAPRSLSIDDADIIPPSGAFTGISTQGLNPLRSVVIKNTRVYNPGGGNFTNAFSNRASPGFSLTVGSVIGTDIRLTFDATAKAVAEQIQRSFSLFGDMHADAVGFDEAVR